MLSNIGIPGMVLILAALLLLFGPSKLPEVGKAFGKTIRAFKDGTKEFMEDHERETATASPSAATATTTAVDPT